MAAGARKNGAASAALAASIRPQTSARMTAPLTPLTGEGPDDRRCRGVEFITGADARLSRFDEGDILARPPRQALAWNNCSDIELF
jgi:hypothetical protein